MNLKPVCSQNPWLGFQPVPLSDLVMISPSVSPANAVLLGLFDQVGQWLF